MFGIGTQELLVILLVVLLLFGGKRIPEVARSVGSGLRDFRKAIRDVQREIDLDELTRTPPPRSGGESGMGGSGDRAARRPAERAGDLQQTEAGGGEESTGGTQGPGGDRAARSRTEGTGDFQQTEAEGNRPSGSGAG
ncbi:MAG: twin-arginine translocase TatA/TatE family subunit [Candidatus Eisenbacteria sp.]|nr:twin-arginine translocase TatA/TatE family subunit [Candidatus Eisenbacteria bacterium]